MLNTGHNTESPLAILKSHFGYDNFRPLQAEIIGNVLAGQDSLVLMPTGGGKSLCYQLPALMFGGVTLVISPLIALMKDQVDALNANGITARFINSSLTASEIDSVQTQTREGLVRILYVAPERLALSGFRRFLQGLDASVGLNLIAIDEAHCISEWGHEFRPDYRNLRQLRQDFPTVPVIALTATATERVREDIIGQLDLQRGRVFLSSFNRANLSYSVQPKGNSWGVLLSLLQSHRNQSTIIYCFSRRETEELAEDLNDRGLTARPYHAGLEPELRHRTQDDFIRDRAPIIVATIAFGMGIDKPDIRLVAHYSLPKSLEGYYQETAGRDGTGCPANVSSSTPTPTRPSKTTSSTSWRPIPNNNGRNNGTPGKSWTRWWTSLSCPPAAAGSSWSISGSNGRRKIVAAATFAWPPGKSLTPRKSPRRCSRR